MSERSPSHRPFHRPFNRPMPANWWAHKPYLNYTLRELTGVAVALYGVILLAGLVCLWLGADAYAAYQDIIASPLSLLLHLLLLIAMLWHVVTWFQTLPKTMPRLILQGKPVPPQRITAMGLLVACVCSVALLAAVVALGAWS
jgi:fumarate reductase subunit C